MEAGDVYTPPTAPAPVPITPQSYDEYRGKGTPLVIDNGSTTLRYGFCTAETPFSGPNVVAKYKERKFNRPVLLFGDAVEVESTAKAQAKTPWEGDVLLNFDALENALDHAFIHLGIDADTIAHPVLMTERLCSPLHSRALTSELMFELYSVPSLAYCVDAMMSFYKNNIPSPPTPFRADGIAVSFNTASTSVIPILQGKGILSHAQRIPWGASQATDYLLKLLQLKYPTFPTRLTSSQANWMLREFCEFSTDYPALLRTLKDPLKLRSPMVERVIQFPFTVAVQEEKSEEELARIAERRREQGKKLQEIAAKTRLEKLVQKEADLQNLLNLRERRAQESKKDWQNTLSAEGFDDDAHFEQTIKKLEGDLKRSRKKEVTAENGEEMEEEIPSFPLVDVPDAELDEDQIKEKRKQKLMKAGYDARQRAKREKEREREERLADEQRERDERERDLTGWADKLKRDHAAIVTKMKGRARRRLELTDRKSAAAQARMKSIANLAAEEKVGRKKRKVGGEDTFGADDADWAIYRKINAEVESSDEEDDLIRLQEVEAKLLEHDPLFTVEDTLASITNRRSALITAFKPVYEEGDLIGKYRIHLNTERWRVPEAWFSPSMAGVDSAGLGEVLQNVLSRFSEAEKGRLVKNVFVTGSPSQLPGLVPRLHASLRPILPPEMPLEIVRAADPALDAWKGMAAYAKTDEFKTVGVTRAEYEEWGGERVKRWWGGNY
ncbi:actin-like ATPase domain-containing protein [Punctularia strigosozonata HHB-11173 SS5]|uniref:actin-like ATPase domain-containing protein n=1 Tax=Punctularia strigosozonata (strain HHB-11173) TaxID=741275 RepID=UPI0004417DC3|nr:actin-like ATPase domain-containing protein [Punctularia strigosozonata HHB-11173 SS5]EIN13328.1 actin-like ATPase domain-containing protein [Punctularia strigosozonata HHB-11173 SS5]